MPDSLQARDRLAALEAARERIERTQAVYGNDLSQAGRDAYLTAVAAAVLVESQAVEWRFVHTNGSVVQASREEVERIASMASGYIEVSSGWHRV